jgi:segregation and condensation protein B
METTQVELKQVLGAIIFAARQPMTTGAVRKVLQETAEINREEGAIYGGIKEAEIKAALHQLQAECDAGKLGVHLVESAEGFRFQSDPAGGPWVRHMLNVGKPTRLSRPALETLAIIAYRQPISRAELEGVRGVAVDHVIRMLMEMQLIKIVGRSELPGRPMLYGTTTLFLEHFGLKDVKELPGIAELARMDAMRKKQEEAVAAVQETSAPQNETVEPDAGVKSEGEEESHPSDPSEASEEDDADEEDEDDEFDDEDEDDEDEDEDEEDEDEEDDEDEEK